MNVALKVLFTPIALVFALVGGLIVGLFLLIAKPIELAITCLCDIWEG